jgi:hypothetical protein
VALLVVGGVVGAILLFWLVYGAVRMAVSDALQRTLDPSLLTAEPESTFRLDEGDDLDGNAAPHGV